ncbi:tumor necrosis factor receptor superfamily member 27 isoform X3 [Pongo pygmaeus]|uniref:tumor necrosis factor receptor superfamily member 27 isoform X3 n=1 Tax=Pongo pygmaeus TaxID=9600 RepID=UPI0023E0DCD9|nr:tumor necrosis factor receptor superfamily member 27 isoform X3 [Pongo pygmaeus]
MDCQENEYWDQWGRCVTCQRCGPGQELSKDCGYGEGGDAYCTACPPRRYKSSWGHHRCQSCITCAVINRVQKVNCTATSNAVCGDCLPRFYRKTRIGGLQDQECIPCTKQTPTSEVQCAFQLSLVEADAPTVPPQEATLVALVSSLLVVFTLAFLGLFFLYCKQFFNRHCQRVAGGLLQFEADKTAKEESLFPVPPSKETSPESQVSWAPGSLAQLFSLDSVPIPQQQQGPEMWCPQELILYRWGYPIPSHQRIDSPFHQD